MGELGLITLFRDRQNQPSFSPLSGPDPGALVGFDISWRAGQINGRGARQVVSRAERTDRPRGCTRSCGVRLGRATW